MCIEIYCSKDQSLHAVCTSVRSQKSRIVSHEQTSSWGQIEATENHACLWKEGCNLSIYSLRLKHWMDICTVPHPTPPPPPRTSVSIKCRRVAIRGQMVWCHMSYVSVGRFLKLLNAYLMLMYRQLGISCLLTLPASLLQAHLNSFWWII